MNLPHAALGVAVATMATAKATTDIYAGYAMQALLRGPGPFRPAASNMAPMYPARPATPRPPLALRPLPPGSLFNKYPFDLPTETFTFERFQSAFAAVQASLVHLQVGAGIGKGAGGLRAWRMPPVKASGPSPAPGPCPLRHRERHTAGCVVSRLHRSPMSLP